MNNYELLKFRELLEELAYAEMLTEGIDLDGDTKSIKFNPRHENNVDTSELINPTYALSAILIYLSRWKPTTKKPVAPDVMACPLMRGWFTVYKMY